MWLLVLSLRVPSYMTIKIKLYDQQGCPIHFGACA